MVAVVEKRLVTKRRRPVPADMLLVQARRARMSGLTQERSAPEEVFAPDEVLDEISVSGDDQLIESESPEGVSSTVEAADDVLLRRPMSQVSLAKVSWSGPIDHDALQEAMLCFPVDKRDVLKRAGLFLDQPFWNDDGSAALEVTLRASDLDVLRGLASADASFQTAPIVRAARLPERISGPEPATRQAVSAVLAAYRRSSLEHAWHTHLSRRDNAELHREREEAAVAVLSTLRALLGER